MKAVSIQIKLRHEHRTLCTLHPGTAKKYQEKKQKQNFLALAKIKTLVFVIFSQTNAPVSSKNWDKNITACRKWFQESRNRSLMQNDHHGPLTVKENGTTCDNPLCEAEGTSSTQDTRLAGRVPYTQKNIFLWGAFKLESIWDKWVNVKEKEKKKKALPPWEVKI